LQTGSGKELCDEKTGSLLLALFLLLTALEACGESAENTGAEENAGTVQAAVNPAAETASW